MNNKFINILLILASGLMIRVAFSNTFYTVDTPSKLVLQDNIASVNSNSADRYALPSNKSYIETCFREGLLRHPGVIDKQQILHQSGNFWVRFEIQAHSGSEWFALCNLGTGEIIREQKLVDAAF